MDIQRIPEIKLQELSKKYTLELFTLPFVALLKMMVAKGSDSWQKVGKTLFYRELDEHKRHLVVVNEARDAVGAV